MAVMRFEAAGNDPDSLPTEIEGICGSCQSISDWWQKWEAHSEDWLSDLLDKTDPWSPQLIGSYYGRGVWQGVVEYSVPEMPTTTLF